MDGAVYKSRTSIAMKDVGLPVAVGNLCRGVVVGVQPGEMVGLRDIVPELDDVRVGVLRAVVLSNGLELNARRTDCEGG